MAPAEEDKGRDATDPEKVKEVATRMKMGSVDSYD
jgi:hypothetical protein